MSNDDKKEEYLPGVDYPRCRVTGRRSRPNSERQAEALAEALKDTTQIPSVELAALRILMRKMLELDIAIMNDPDDDSEESRRESRRSFFEAVDGARSAYRVVNEVRLELYAKNKKRQLYERHDHVAEYVEGTSDLRDAEVMPKESR